MNRYDIALGKKPEPGQTKEDKKNIKIHFIYSSEKEKGLVQALNDYPHVNPKTLMKQYIIRRLKDSGDLPESFPDVAAMHGITLPNDSSIDWGRLGFVTQGYNTTAFLMDKSVTTIHTYNTIASLNNYTRNVLERL